MNRTRPFGHSQFKRDVVQVETRNPVTVPDIRAVKGRVPMVVQARRVQVLRRVVANLPVVVIRGIIQRLMAIVHPVPVESRVGALLRRQAIDNICYC